MTQRYPLIGGRELRGVEVGCSLPLVDLKVIGGQIVALHPQKLGMDHTAQTLSQRDVALQRGEGGMGIAWQKADLSSLKFGVGEVSHIGRDRLAGIELSLDAVESGPDQAGQEEEWARGVVTGAKLESGTSPGARHAHQRRTVPDSP